MTGSRDFEATRRPWRRPAFTNPWMAVTRPCLKAALEINAPERAALGLLFLKAGHQ